MATVTVDLEPGESITIICGSVWEYEDDPDPGEEAPEDEKPSLLKAVGQ